MTCPRRLERKDTASSELNFLCTNTSGFACADCRTLIYCIDGLAYADPCSSNNFCGTRNGFKGPVCHHQQPEECSCTSGETLKPDPNNEHRFLECRSGSEGVPVVRQCMFNQVYDKEIGFCKDKDERYSCTRMGVFADPSSCSGYYACIMAPSGWIQNKFQCENDMFFNEQNIKCENPCEWIDSSFSCKEKGRYPLFMDCSLYYECSKANNSWMRTFRKCPEGFYWKQDEQFADGFCIEQAYSTCMPSEIMGCNFSISQCFPEDVGIPIVMHVPEKIKDTKESYGIDISFEDSNELGYWDFALMEDEGESSGSYFESHFKKILDLIKALHKLSLAMESSEESNSNELERSMQ